MDPVAIATLLEKYGPWGVVALLLVAVAVLYRAGVGTQDKCGAYAERAVVAVERSAATLATLTAAMEAQNRILDDIGRLVTESARQSEAHDDRAQEKLSDIARRVEDISRSLGGRSA